jgi:hypothetical protein
LSHDFLLVVFFNKLNFYLEYAVSQDVLRAASWCLCCGGVCRWLLGSDVGEIHPLILGFRACREILPYRVWICSILLQSFCGGFSGGEFYLSAVIFVLGVMFMDL